MDQGQLPTNEQRDHGFVVDRAAVERHAQEVQEHLLRYDGHQMVVNLFAFEEMRVLARRDDYGFPYVEYAALVYWQQATSLATETLTAEAVVKAHAEIGRLVSEVGLLYHHEASMAKSNKDLEELALRAKHAGLMIRNPAFEQHHKAVLDGLFSPIDDDVRNLLGFTASDVLACFSTFPDVWWDGRKAFNDAFKEAAKSGTRVNFSQRFGDYFTLSADDISSRANISIEIVAKILDAFSVKFGEPTAHVLLPSPFSLLREKPLLHLGDERYLVTNPSLLVPSIQQRIENLLNPSVNPAARERLWTRYERHRGKWVEETCYALIQRMIPHGRGTVGAYYPNPVDGSQAEADVIYEVDDLVILVEAKSGAFTPASFRGAPGSLKDDITDVIQKGHEQTIRTEQYITGGDHTFNDEHGNLAFSLSQAPREMLRMVVTLAPTDIFATSATLLQRAGLMQGDLTWVLPLTDLMILADCLSLPGELRYYARQRYKAISDERLLVFDETDLLGIYLSNNDMLIFTDEAYDTILPDFGVADKLNDYYLYNKVKMPPRQSIARPLQELIQAIAVQHSPKWTHAVCDIFGLSGSSRDDVAQGLVKTVRIKDGVPHDFSVVARGEWTITITAMDAIAPSSLAELFISHLLPRQEDTGKRLVIAYNPSGKTAAADYYQKVMDRFYRVPPELFWQSSIRKN